MPRASLRLLLCLLLAAGSCSKERSAWLGPLHHGTPIILISIDTLRADHLPAYGYSAVKTPNIDALRRDSILYQNAYSNCPLTLPSHISVLTGLLPPQHGVRNNIGFRFDGLKHQTLPAVLKPAGYVTGAAVSSYVLRGSTGIASGFDFYEDAIASKPGVAVGQLQRPGSATVAIARQWLEANGKKPFFFFLHLFEPHYPYEPPEPFRSAYPLAYDGEIALTDSLVGQFLDDLKKDDLYDRSMIFLISDHGEGLNNHGEQEHGIFLYREAVQVPLMVKLPQSRNAGATVSTPAQLIDVFPTITQLLDLNMPPGSQGKSLMKIGQSPPRRIFSETIFPRLHLGWSELQSLIDDEHHFINAPRPELYDLRNDPAEKTNVIEQQRRIYSAMRKEIETYQRAIGPAEAVTQEEAARLAALGYVGTIRNPSGALPDPKDGIDEMNQMISATRLAAEKKYREAMAAYRSILSRNPRLSDAWNSLAMVQEETGQYSAAAESYVRAIRSAPELATEYALSLGAVLIKLQKFDEAEKHARFVLEAKPAAAHQLLGRIALARGQLAKAEEEARKAGSDSNYRIPALILLAEILVQQNRLSAALAVLDKATAETQRTMAGPIESLQFTRADALARLNRNREAETGFKEEIRFFPQNLQAYTSLAVLFRLEGRREEALRTVEEMTVANPNPRAFSLAARTLETLGESASAAKLRRRTPTF